VGSSEELKELGALYHEYLKASEKFGSFASSHEGYAIIKEEIDELWDEIKDNKRPGTIGRQRKEALQVAAMGLRYLIDIKEES
jgi:hypothetical protein